MKKIPAQSLLLVLLIVNLPAFAQYEENIKVHDPVMIKQADMYYLFCTGMGVSVFSSKDMKSWKQEKPVFEKAPDWAFSIAPEFRGHIWAPDISYYNGKYYLYYSVSAFGKNTSAIGLATNPTLDPSDPQFKWTDHGPVVQSVPGRDLWNAIDPNIIVDQEGYSWLTFGSFWEGLKLVKLIPNRTALATPQEWYTIAKRKRSSFLPDKQAGDASIEAPFIFHKNEYYYLFVSWDYCCKGKESTYKVVVGRSKSVTGPYLDKDGKSMFEGGGSLVIEGNGNYAGVGHNSAYTFDSKDYFVFHAYEMKDGQSRLRVKEIKWENGWPTVTPME